MRRSHFALAVLVALLVLALPQVASAKGLEPLRVVTLSGKVGWIRGASAKAWWTDYSGQRAGSCSCGSPNEVARFANRVMGRVDWRSYPDGGWAPAMLVQAGHTAPMLYYPASDSTPPYLVTPAAQGAHGLRWDDWHVVTSRMQRIMTAALKDGTVSSYTGSQTFPTGWAVGGGLGAILLAALILSARRRPRAQEGRGERLPHPGG
jgi:hypothetical protein